MFLHILELSFIKKFTTFIKKEKTLLKHKTYPVFSESINIEEDECTHLFIHMYSFIHEGSCIKKRRVVFL